MRMIKGSWISGLLGLTMVSAIGCGGSSSPTEKYCQDYATGLCHKAYSCTPAAMQDANFHNEWGPSEAMCTAGFSQLCATSCNGKQINQAAETQCLSGLNAATCASVADSTIGAGCENVCVDAPTNGSGGNSGGGVGGNSGGFGGSSGGTGAAAIAFCKAFHNSICDRAFQCVPVASQDANFVGSFGATITACKAMTDTACVDPATNCPNYNATEGNSCTAAWAVATCTLFTSGSVPPSCLAACP